MATTGLIIPTEKDFEDAKTARKNRPGLFDGSYLHTGKEAWHDGFEQGWSMALKAMKGERLR